MGFSQNSIKCHFWGIQNWLLQKVTTNLGSESLGMRYATPDGNESWKRNVQAQDPPLSEMGSTSWAYPQKNSSHIQPQKNQGPTSDLICVGILWHLKQLVVKLFAKVCLPTAWWILLSRGHRTYLAPYERDTIIFQKNYLGKISFESIGRTQQRKKSWVVGPSS